MVLWGYSGLAVDPVSRGSGGRIPGRVPPTRGVADGPTPAYDAINRYTGTDDMLHTDAGFRSSSRDAS